MIDSPDKDYDYLYSVLMLSGIHPILQSVRNLETGGVVVSMYIGYDPKRVEKMPNRMSKSGIAGAAVIRTISSSGDYPELKWVLSGIVKDGARCTLIHLHDSEKDLAGLMGVLVYVDIQTKSPSLLNAIINQAVGQVA